MKTKYLLLIFLNLIMSLPIKAQIAIQTVGTSVICCDDSVSIDIDNNNSDDLKVKSMFEGIDSYNFNITPLQNNIMVQNNPIDSGNVFSNLWLNFGLISQTSINCDWSNMYPPGSGYKYQGFRRINAPSDTTFGWVKLNFVGDYNCADTVFILELGYSTIPNVHLYAGQTTSTSINEIDIPNTIFVFPNPTTDLIYFDNISPLRISTYKIYEEIGKLVKEGNIENNSVEVKDLTNGLYFIQVISENKTSFGKFVKG